MSGLNAVSFIFILDHASIQTISFFAVGLKITKNNK